VTNQPFNTIRHLLRSPLRNLINLITLKITFEYQLESLKRKRANCRGQITKIQRKLTSFITRYPRDVTASEVNLAIASLDQKIDNHEDLSDQVEELLLEDTTSLDREHEDRETKDDTYTELKAKLHAFKERLSVWAKGSALCTELNARFTTDDPTNSAFVHSFDRFEDSVSNFRVQAVSHLEDDEISTQLKQLQDKLEMIRREMEAAITKKPTTVVITEPRPTAPRAAPITVQLPKFDGNPLNWRSFESTFTAAIKTRAVGFSNLDVRSLLLDSLQSERAREIIRAYPDEDTPMEDLLKALKLDYGRPQVIVPLLLNKVEHPHKFSNTYEGIHDAFKQFIRPVEELIPILEARRNLSRKTHNQGHTELPGDPPSLHVTLNLQTIYVIIIIYNFVTR